MPALILVLLRWADLRPEVDPISGVTSRDVRSAGFSAADEAALELALRIAPEWSATVLAVSAGPAAARDALRAARAVGAGVLYLPWPAGAAPGEPLGTQRQYLADLAEDAQPLARGILSAVRAHTGRHPELVLCGDRSVDRGTGTLPGYLAAELGAAQALGCVALDAVGEDLVVQRRLDGGWRERLRVSRPAVCSVEGAGIQLRRAALPAVLAAGRAPVPLAEVAAQTGRVRLLGSRAGRPRPRVVTPPTGNARERLVALTGALTAAAPPTVLGPLEPPAAVEILLQFLLRTGYLIPPPGAPAPVGRPTGPP